MIMHTLRRLKFYRQAREILEELAGVIQWELLSSNLLEESVADLVTDKRWSDQGLALSERALEEGVGLVRFGFSNEPFHGDRGVGANHFSVSELALGSSPASCRERSSRDSFKS